MSSIRIARVAQRLVAAPRPSVARPAFRASQRAAFSVSACRTIHRLIIKETEVPVSVYNPDGKGAGSSASDRFTIPVKPGSDAPQPVVEEQDVVTPLQEKVYRQMPRTLQNMSVMGKVIIITG